MLFLVCFHYSCLLITTFMLFSVVCTFFRFVCVCVHTIFFLFWPTSRTELVRKSCLLLTYIEILKWCKYARKFTLQNNHMVVSTNAGTVLRFVVYLYALFFSSPPPPRLLSPSAFDLWTVLHQSNHSQGSM